jgi:Protein of unknown function (DUF3775)
LTEILVTQPEILALQQAIIGLPQDIRRKLWTVARLGRGDVTLLDWEKTIASAALMTDDDMTADLMAESDLHDCLRKGLYLAGATHLPGDQWCAGPDGDHAGIVSSFPALMDFRLP